MKRADAVQLITISLAQDDTKTATRLFIEHRISGDAFQRCHRRAREIKRLLAQGIAPFDALKQTRDVL